MTMQRDDEGVSPVGDTSRVTAPRSPLVFISHDSRDSALAEAFEELLVGASGGTLKAFRSSDSKGTSGLPYGVEWYRMVMEKLNEAACVVALLTQNSVGRPWILYEAGVAQGRQNTIVFGVTIGVPMDSLNSSPFQQFQNCGDDEDALTKLVIQLITQAQPGATPRENAVRMHVATFRDQIETAVAESKAKPPEPRVDIATVARMVEEVKVAVQDMSESRPSLRRSRRFHPFMLEEIVLRSRGPEEFATGWLVFISMLRDDFPWFYELGMQLYQALSSGNTEAIEQARERLVRTVEQMAHSRMMMEMFDDREAFMILRHLPEVLEESLGRLTATKPRRRRQVAARQEQSSGGA